VKFAAGTDKFNRIISGKNQYFSLGTITIFKQYFDVRLFSKEFIG
jgi:hypothetical protein